MGPHQERERHKEESQDHEPAEEMQEHGGTRDTWLDTDETQRWETRGKLESTHRRENKEVDDKTRW